MKKLIKKLFHRHKFETEEIPYSNEFGEIWLQKCNCGAKREILFDSNKKVAEIIIDKVN